MNTTDMHDHLDDLRDTARGVSAPHVAVDSHPNPTLDRGLWDEFEKLGFIGLCAPAAVRLTAKVVPAVAAHAVLLPLSGLVGAVLVLGSDALLRALLKPIPVTSLPLGLRLSSIDPQEGGLFAGVVGDGLPITR